MAEDSGDKTEAPTPKRRQEAREQGNIARSADLTAAVLIVGALMMLDWFGAGLFTSLKAMLQEMLSVGTFRAPIAEDTFQSMLRGIAVVARAAAPFFAGVVVIAILINIVQVGFYLGTARIKPKPGMLNPIKGFGRIFGGGQGIVGLGMSVLKVFLVGAVAYSAVSGRIGEIITVQQLSFIQIFLLGSDIVFQIGIRIGVLLLVLSLIDFAWQKYRTEQKLKMSKQQVKDEMKRMEGDPLMKQRRRQIANAISQQRAKKAVPTADVVVTNPTEFAVAIKYDPATMNAPRVVAKGQGFMAARIRQLAIEAGVPILERKPLARALYKLVEVGGEVPEQFYSAIAEILAYVYELSGKLKQRKAG